MERGAFIMVASSHFPPSPSIPLLPPPLASSALPFTEKALHYASDHGTSSFAGVLWSAAEEAFTTLPRVQLPHEKGGDGIYIERTLFDALLPINATISLALAFVTASANELTRSGKINDFADYIAGEDPETPEGEKLPPSLPWEWDRVGHDTVANLTRDCGAQTLTRLIERRMKAAIGPGASYCELLKHAHKAACKEFHECRALPGQTGMSASAAACRIVKASPTFYGVRAVTGYFADVFVDCVAWLRGQLSKDQLISNAGLKMVKYAASGALCLAFGMLVPFIYPHPYIFIGVEQLGANILAETIVGTIGDIEPS